MVNTKVEMEIAKLVNTKILNMMTLQYQNCSTILGVVTLTGQMSIQRCYLDA